MMWLRCVHVDMMWTLNEHYEYMMWSLCVHMLTLCGHDMIATVEGLLAYVKTCLPINSD